MVLKAPKKKKIFGPNFKKNLLKNRLIMRVRNFAPLNKTPNIFIKFFILTPKSPSHKETLWCINHQNPSNRKSHTWAPLKEVSRLLPGIQAKKWYVSWASVDIRSLGLSIKSVRKSPGFSSMCIILQCCD